MLSRKNLVENITINDHYKMPYDEIIKNALAFTTYIINDNLLACILK